MDTSADYVSPTLDFILGQGTNLPTPTDEDFAHLLFAVLDELDSRDVLADLIGNRTREHMSNYMLGRALADASTETQKNLDKVRAKGIYVTHRTDNTSDESTRTTSHIYIACTRTDAYWLLVEKSETKQDPDRPYTFTQLDVRSMMEFFSHYREYADHIGSQILRELISAVRLRNDEWEDKQQRLQEAAVFLSCTSERVASACTTPWTSGNGIEG